MFGKGHGLSFTRRQITQKLPLDIIILRITHLLPCNSAIGVTTLQKLNFKIRRDREKTSCECCRVYESVDGWSLSLGYISEYLHKKQFVPRRVNYPISVQPTPKPIALIYQSTVLTKVT